MSVKQYNSRSSRGASDKLSLRSLDQERVLYRHEGILFLSFLQDVAEHRLVQRHCTSIIALLSSPLIAYFVPSLFVCRRRVVKKTFTNLSSLAVTVALLEHLTRSFSWGSSDRTNQKHTLTCSTVVVFCCVQLLKNVFAVFARQVMSKFPTDAAKISKEEEKVHWLNGSMHTQEFFTRGMRNFNRDCHGAGGF